VAEASVSPMIYLLPNRAVATSHGTSILHMAFHGELLYSFGETGNSYTINVHNHQTGVMVDSRSVSERVDRFLLIGDRQFLSVRKIRLWRNLYPSEVLGEACCADLLPS